MQVQQKLPFLLRQTEQALSIDGSLIPVRYAARELRGMGRVIDVQSSYFAYKIPYLPDQLTSSHLVGGSERERLAEVLNQNVRMITNLGKRKDLAFALRFQTDPQVGEIKIFLLVRSLHAKTLTEQSIQHFSQDVADALGSFGYPTEPLTSETELRSVLAPIANPMVLEIRQHEELAGMIYGDAYVVYPFRPRSETWISICQMLLKQINPCVLSIYLEPTQLFAFENECLTQAAQIAETLADVQYEGYVTTGRVVDPVARLVSRLYADYLLRFVDPYLLTIQVASVDPLATQNIAQAFAAELSETRSFQEIARDTPDLPSGYDVVVPRNQTELEMATHSFTNLEILPWGEGVATKGKERLRYLVDANTAAAIFRFPIAVRGGIPGIRTRQTAPSFEVGPRRLHLHEGEILVGRNSDHGGITALGINQLNRHMLIVGTTGSGKTTTCMHLLSQLWQQGIPFLVIEPAKTEYRVLIDSPIGKDIQVFTLGDESVSPYRLNPLEIFPGVQVETHISSLRACFEAALPSFGVLPSLIEESLQNVYFDKGWELTQRGSKPNSSMMPVLGELYFEIIRVTEGRGYSEKTLQDIRAAAAGRIGSLLLGSKGRMLNTRRSIPLAQIMTRPTILELDMLNDEEKALVMMFLLTVIREYCLTTRENDRLQHITLIEEAHRVMTNTAHAADREVSADTRAQAVSMFSNTLSEVRAFGEGLMIAEQIPNRLAEDALKNTNIKVVHRLPGSDDRQALGGTMNLSQEQEAFLPKLPAGEAAYFTEGYERPIFVCIPNYKKENGLPGRIFGDKLGIHMAEFWDGEKTLLTPFSGCAHCQRICRYRDRIAKPAYDVKAWHGFQKALWEYETAKRQGSEREGWDKIMEVCKNAVRTIGYGADGHAAFCYFTHLWGYEFTQAMVERFWKTWEV